jgi:hypothetical protein
VEEAEEDMMKTKQYWKAIHKSSYTEIMKNRLLSFQVRDR